MAYFRNPLFDAEPYEEQAEIQHEPSAKELTSFYQQQQLERKRSKLERKVSKISRRESKSGGFWHRKKASSPPQPSQQPRPAQLGAQQAKQSDHSFSEMQTLEEEKDGPPPTVISPRSIIPDPLKDLPAWYSKEDYNSLSYYRTKFPMHNPIGPKYYRNFHLIPPSELRPAARPPSVFSSSFPAMTVSHSQDRSEDSTRLPPSRTPSVSPLPTPTSSETRVTEAGKRSRKTSLTAQDTVDMMDVTDPWGASYHHTSPYDIGISSGSVSPEEASRSRHTSVTLPTKETRRRTVTPSPLSQSTSAIHLQPTAPEPQVRRRLSKRNTKQQVSASLPATPTDEPNPNRLSSVASENLHGTTTTAPPPSLDSRTVSSRKEKRGSVLVRLAKKFSLLRKSGNEEADLNRQRQSVLPSAQSASEKSAALPGELTAESTSSSFSVQRDPSPQMNSRSEKDDHDSLLDLEAPFGVGRLTVANPDSPSSDNTSPPNGTVPLPQDSDTSTVKQEGNLREFPMAQAADVDLQIEPITAMTINPSFWSPPLSVTTSAITPSMTISPPKATSRPPSPTVASHQSRNSRKPVPAASTSEVLSQKVVDFDHNSFSSNAAYVSTREEVQSKGEPKKRHSAIVPSENSAKPQQNFSSPSLPQKRHSFSDRHSESSHKSKKTSKQKTPVQLPDDRQPPLAPSYITAMISIHGQGDTDVEGSPLSTASMIVNPPTPRNSDIPMPSMDAPPPLPPKRSSLESKHTVREPSPGTSIRQTETFKLVRSPSGLGETSTEATRAEGEQWAVMETFRRDASSSKSRDKDSNSSRGLRESEGESRDRSRQHDGRYSSESTRPTRRSDAIPRSGSLDRDLSKPHEARRSKSDREERRQARIDSNAHKKRSSVPPEIPAKSTSPVQRKPSASARPTSEVPSTADLNSLRAREAWEMERLYKARSMYGTDANGHASGVPAYANVPTTAVPVSDGTVRSTHGSSHTSFQVQNTFNGPIGSNIYHSMPNVPAPVVYIPPAFSQTKSRRRRLSTGDSPKTTSLSDIFCTSDNPLPAPPRESSYQPSPIPHILY